MSQHDHAEPHQHGSMKTEAQDHTYEGFLRACVIVGGISTVVLLYLAACVA